MKNYTLKYFVYKTPHSTGGLGELAKAVDLPNIEGKARVWFRCDCKRDLCITVLTERSVLKFIVERHTRILETKTILRENEGSYPSPHPTPYSTWSPDYAVICAKCKQGFILSMENFPLEKKVFSQYWEEKRIHYQLLRVFYWHCIDLERL